MVNYLSHKIIWKAPQRRTCLMTSFVASTITPIKHSLPLTSLLDSQTIGTSRTSSQQPKLAFTHLKSSRTSLPFPY